MEFPEGRALETVRFCVRRVDVEPILPLRARILRPGPPPRPRPRALGFIAGELAFIAAAHALGGPPWVVLGVLVMLGQIGVDFRMRPLLGLLVALAWLAAAHLTGNRELFFPYSIALAAHLACQFAVRGRLPAAAAAGLVAGAFLAIRLVQGASAGVLAVEAAVAATILAAVVTLVPAARRWPWIRSVITAGASLSACAGLAL